MYSCMNWYLIIINQTSTFVQWSGSCTAQMLVQWWWLTQKCNIRAFLYCTGVHLNTLPLLPPHALSPHTAEGCVDPVCLIYVTRLPHLIMQYAAPLVQSLWETCDTVTYVRFKSVAMHWQNKITLIWLRSPHMINKIHLNSSLLPLFHIFTTFLT